MGGLWRRKGQVYIRRGRPTRGAGAFPIGTKMRCIANRHSAESAGVSIGSWMAFWVQAEAVDD